MSAAADRREDLEAVIHAQLTRAWKYGLRAPSDPRGNGAKTPAQVVLAAADAYADAAREAGYTDAVARAGHAMTARDPGEPPRVVPGAVVRELTAAERNGRQP